MITEPKTKRLTIRLTESDFDYLRVVSYMAGMTLSQYLRTLCDASINAVKVAESEGKVNIANIKTLLND